MNSPGSISVRLSYRAARVVLLTTGLVVSAACSTQTIYAVESELLASSPVDQQYVGFVNGSEFLVHNAESGLRFRSSSQSEWRTLQGLIDLPANRRQLDWFRYAAIDGSTVNSIVYEACRRSNDCQILVEPLDGSSPPVSLSAAQTPHRATSFAWIHPNSEAVYFGLGRDQIADAEQIFAVPMSGTTSRLVLTAPSGHHVYQAVPIPNSHEVILRSSPTDDRDPYSPDVGRSHFYVTDVAHGGPARELAAPSDTVTDLQSPLVTSQGDWLVFTGRDAISNHLGIYKVPIDGSAPYRTVGNVNTDRRLLNFNRDKTAIYFQQDGATPEDSGLFLAPVGGEMLPQKLIEGFDERGVRTVRELRDGRLLYETNNDHSEREIWLRDHGGESLRVAVTAANATSIMNDLETSLLLLHDGRISQVSLRGAYDQRLLDEFQQADPPLLTRASPLGLFENWLVYETRKDGQNRLSAYSFDDERAFELASYGSLWDGMPESFTRVSSVGFDPDGNFLFATSNPEYLHVRRIPARLVPEPGVSLWHILGTIGLLGRFRRRPASSNNQGRIVKSSSNSLVGSGTAARANTETYAGPVSSDRCCIRYSSRDS